MSPYWFPFDAQRLQEIIAELGEQLQPIAADSRLKDIKHTLTLVDGSLISALPQMMEASWLKSNLSLIHISEPTRPY